MTKLASFAALAATLCAPLLAHADNGAPGMTAPLTAPPAMATTTASTETPKSENTALALSLGGTAASAALVFIGGQTDNSGMVSAGVLSSLITPSLGEWYAGRLLTPGMGIRAVSAVATVWGVAEAFKCWDYQDTSTSCSSSDAAGVAIVGGLIGYAGGTLYDIATAPREARRYNERHGLRLTVAPTPLRTPSGQATMGVGIGGTF